MILEQRKELEAQIAKVKSDATIDSNAKQQKITELTNKLAQVEKDYKDKLAGQKTALEAEIARVRNDANISLQDKDRKITELTNKLAQVERDYQNQLAGQKAALEAEIAKVRNDANTSLAEKDRKIAELNQQIADNIAKAREGCQGFGGSMDVKGGTGADLFWGQWWDSNTNACRFWIEER